MHKYQRQCYNFMCLHCSKIEMQQFDYMSFVGDFTGRNMIKEIARKGLFGSDLRAIPTVQIPLRAY